MRITLIALGTRGDVQPIIAVGRALQAAGHRVRLLAGTDFKAWIESYGLEAATSSVDIKAMMESGVKHFSLLLQPSPVATRSGAATFNAPRPDGDSLFNYLLGKLIIERVLWALAAWSGVTPKIRCGSSARRLSSASTAPLS